MFKPLLSYKPWSLPDVWLHHLTQKTAMDHLLRCWYFKRCCLRLGFSCGDFDALQSSIRCSLCQWLSCKGPQFNSKRRSFEDHINIHKHREVLRRCSRLLPLQQPPKSALSKLQRMHSECTWKLGDSWLTKVCQWPHRPIWSGVLGWDKLLWSGQCRERTELCSVHRVSWDFQSPHKHHEFHLIAATNLLWSSYENVNAVRQKAFNLFEQTRKRSSGPSLRRFHLRALKRRETPHYCPSTSFYFILTFSTHPQTEPLSSNAWFWTTANQSLWATRPAPTTTLR